MARRLEGYNIRLKLINPTVYGGYIAAVTSDSFDLKANIKERITKDDKGVKKSFVDKHEFEFSAEGFVAVNESGEAMTQLDRDSVIDTLIDGAELLFYYGAFVDGESILWGNVVITGYSEKSDSENDATFSVNFKSISQLTVGTWTEV